MLAAVLTSVSDVSYTQTVRQCEGLAMKRLFYFSCFMLFASPNIVQADDVAACRAYLEAKNYQIAVVKCTSAAEQGDDSAQTNLGMMYADGLGVEQDFGEAIRLYVAASKQGNSPARMLLAFHYLRGQGVAASNISALKWFILAAEGNSELAVIMRDNQASKMAPDEIASAQRRAEGCMNTKFADC